jgi:hypothetical protein
MGILSLEMIIKSVVTYFRSLQFYHNPVTTGENYIRFPDFPTCQCESSSISRTRVVSRDHVTHSVLK